MKKGINSEQIIQPVRGSACKLLNFLHSWITSVVSENDLATDKEIKFSMEFVENDDSYGDERLVVHVMVPIDAQLESFHAVTNALGINIAKDGRLTDNMDRFDDMYEKDFCSAKNRAELLVGNIYVPVEYTAEYQDQTLVDIMPSLQQQSAKALASSILPLLSSKNIAFEDDPEDVIEKVKIDICFHILPDVSGSYDIAEAISVFGEMEVMAYIRQKQDLLDVQAQELESVIEDEYSKFIMMDPKKDDSASIWVTIDDYVNQKENYDFEDSDKTESIEEITITDDDESSVTKEQLNLEGIEVIDND
jgi:hypothetical protein